VYKHVQRKLLISKTAKESRQNIDFKILPDIPKQQSDFYNTEKFREIVEPSTNRPEPNKIYKCSPGFLQGIAQNSENKYYKIITCGKEWCPDCGAINSIVHDRRILRIYKKILSMHSIKQSTGYLVVTIPAGLRNQFSKEALNDFRNFWRRKLKREGYECGVLRYHWCGEDGKTWKPHLNILLPEAWIDPEILNKWRKQVAQWFTEYFELPKPIAPNLWYQYTPHISKTKFWIRYVTRATQLTYINQNCEIIKGFRNTAPFGNFPKIEVQAETEAGTVIKGYEVDTETGEANKINWLKKFSVEKNKFVPDLLPVKIFQQLKAVNIGAGFWKSEPDFSSLPEI
jgi:hypothetical protein